MRIIVAGGSGFIGGALCAELLRAGHAVIVLTRDVEKAGPVLGDHIETVEWDVTPGGYWMSAVDGADGVVNLAGENIGASRWTRARKARILNSRLSATNALVEAIGKARSRPAVMVNISGVGYYGGRGDEIITEKDGAGSDFVAGLVYQWEEAAKKVEAYGVRLVVLRAGIALGEGGGALARMLLPFRLFVGGPLGSGKQWFSWVHRDDLVGLILFSLQNTAVRGVLNAAAPEPQTMKDFCRTLGQVMGRPSWAPVPAWVLKIVLGEMSQMVLTGQRVMPVAAEKAGYEFKYPTLEAALSAVLRK